MERENTTKNAEETERKRKYDRRQLALRARWFPPPKIKAPKSQENKGMNLATKILSSIFTIAIICLVFMASVFILSIFLPDNVERAIEIFKNIL